MAGVADTTSGIARPRQIRPASTRGVLVAMAMVTLGSLANFLAHNGYPLWRPEVAAAAAILLAGCLLLAAAYRWAPALLKLLFTPLLAAYAVDLNVNDLGPTGNGLASVGAFVLGAALTRHLPLLLTSVFASVLAFAVVGTTMVTSTEAGERAPAQASAGQAPFALVHVVLDEHMGVEGLPDDLPEAAALGGMLKDFYLTRGFRLYGGAYSEALHTVNAVPRTFQMSVAAPWPEPAPEGGALAANPYFDALAEKALAIQVFQSDYLDFCRHPAVTSCRTHRAGTLIGAETELSFADRVLHLTQSYLSLSALSTVAVRIYDLAAVRARRAGLDLPVLDALHRAKASSVAGMATYDALIDRAGRLRPGQALFAHVLLPHYPYSYDPACRLLPYRSWIGRHSPYAWAARYKAYADQVRCATRKTGELLDAVARSPAAGRTVVVVHGDHGSRITRLDPLLATEGRFSARDLVDGHATLFAAAVPGIAASYDPRPLPLPLLLRAVVEGGEPQVPDGFSPTVMLVDLVRRPRREHPLPPFR